MLNENNAQFNVNLTHFSGSLEVLLDLAKSQKVNLENISITKLADQFHDFISNSKDLDLELASEYLLMATWLAYLKSKLLLPESEDDDFNASNVALTILCGFELPTDFATIIETAASPVTLTIVLHISNGLSTAIIKASPASGIPAWPRTITSITIPALGTAAAPIEARVAVTIIPNCAPRLRSKPNAWAINTAATAW